MPPYRKRPRPRPQAPADTSFSKFAARHPAIRVPVGLITIAALLTIGCAVLGALGLIVVLAAELVGLSGVGDKSEFWELVGIGLLSLVPTFMLVGFASVLGEDVIAYLRKRGDR